MRLPIMAGKFYPAQKSKLVKEIKENLKKHHNNTPEPQILILPHAGYMFAGQVMAAGFKQVQNQNINKIFIIGPCHRPLNKICFYKNGPWKTPLGEIKIKQNILNKLENDLNDSDFKFAKNPHKNEHSIEVLLPFLQVILDNFKIIPILTGETSRDKNEKLAKILKKYIDENTLVIISSDLSHYPSKKIAETEDKKTIASIKNGNLKEFKKRLKQPKSFATYACGSEGIKIALRLKKALKLKEGHFIKYQNSGDISGQDSQVVGYGAISFN